jgi:hypothetical protein
MNNEEIIKEIDILLSEVNRPMKLDSPLFSQKAFDFSEVVSKCGKLWARAKANFEGQKIEFEIWESLEELNIRSHQENISSAKEIINNSKNKSERITEGKIKALVKTSSEYRTKRKHLIEAEELFNLVDKALHDAAKLRGFIGQAIVKKRDEL